MSTRSKTSSRSSPTRAIILSLLLLIGLACSRPAHAVPVVTPTPDAVPVPGQDPNDVVRAERALKAGDPETALELADKILAYDPGRVPAMLVKAAALRALERYADALTAARTAVLRNVADPNAWRLLATVYVDMGRGTEAENAARRAIKLDPTSALNYNALGLALRTRGAALRVPGPASTEAEGDMVMQRALVLDEAVRVLETATQMDPTLADAWINLGAVLTDLKRYAPATRALEHGLLLEPGSTAAHVTLGVARMQRNDLVGASRELEEALRINPFQTSALVNLAAVRYQQGRTAEALNLAQQALEREAANPQALVLRGTIRRDAGKTDAARRDLELAVKLAPGDGAAHAAYGTLLLNTGDAEEARAELESAVSLGADDSAVENNLALAYKLLARYDRSRVHFERALQMSPDSPDVHYNLAVMLDLAGDRRGAAQSYEDYLKLLPGAPDAAEVRERVKELLRPQTKD